ncbi:MAG: type II secretion system F family protein, partial [Burkholderiales bacterium]
MDSNLTLVAFSALSFLAVALLVDGLLTWWRANRSAEARRVRARIERINSSATSDPLEVVESVVRVRPLSKIQTINAALGRLPGVDRIDQFLRQAKVDLDVDQFLALSAICGLVCMGFVAAFLPNPNLAFIAGPLAACTPWVVIQRRQEERLKRFNSQLPDALDAMARALKAGYSVVGAMKVVGEEMP